MERIKVKEWPMGTDKTVEDTHFIFSITLICIVQNLGQIAFISCF